MRTASMSRVDPWFRMVDFSLAWDTIMGLVRGTIALLPILAIGAIVFAVFYAVGHAVRTIIVRTTANRVHANVGLVMGRLARWGLTFTGLLIAATIVIPSVTVGTLIGVLGLTSVAVGFAFKDILQNFLAGILILLQEPFRVGDQITVGEHEGTVEEIRTRATKIRTYDNRRIVIPNADLYTDAVTVHTAFENRRSEFVVGIGYGEDLPEAKRIIADAVATVDGVLDDPAPEALTEELAGSSVDIKVRWWTKADRSTVVHVTDRVITAVKLTLDDAGVDIPFPIRTVLFEDRADGRERLTGEAARDERSGPRLDR